MAKPRKIKRYNHRGKSSGGLRLLGVTFSLLVFAALMIFIGISIYQPVYDFIMNSGKETPPVPIPELEEDASSEPEDWEEEETEPASPAVQAGSLRMAYLPLETARNGLDAFLASLEGSDINAVMLDVKDSQGRLWYRTTHPQAVEWGAQGENPVDLLQLSNTLEARGLHLVARMTAFSDPIGARGDRIKNAIHYQTSEMLWLDNSVDAGGKPWLNPYSPEAVEYLTGIAEELVELGAVMVVLEGVRFPDDMGGYANYGTDAQSISRQEALRAFTEKVAEAVEQKGGRLAVYIPSAALTQSQSENRYGAVNPLDSTEQEVILGLLPGQYENGYSSMGLELERPLENPAGTVAAILAYAEQNRGKASAMIPMLLGGNESGGTLYTAEQIHAQIEVVRGAGYEEYALYTSQGTYLLLPVSNQP